MGVKSGIVVADQEHMRADKVPGAFAAARRRYSILSRAMVALCIAMLAFFISQSAGVRQLYWMIICHFGPGE
jgi:hypothetical protein